MAQPRAGPPPVPPRVDLGETEESTPDSQEYVSVNPQPSTELNCAPKIDTSEPVVTPKSSSSTPPDASKPPITTPLPIAKTAKPVPKKEPKARPTISIISARPMDQSSSLPSVQFGNVNAEGSDNNNKHSATTEAAAQVPKRPPGLKKPSKPSPFAPKKPPPKLENNSQKPTDTSKTLAPVRNLRSKSKTSKKDTGSVFYIDTSMDTASVNTPSFNNSSDQTVQKPKETPPQPNVKSKPSLLMPRKSKTKEEQKASEIDPNAKVKSPDKIASKPKLKPTIITAKTPKQQGKADEMKISKNVNTSSAKKTGDDDRPTRPSFPPSATADELNKSENQPERPKAPPNTSKEEQINVEMKRGQKKGEKNLQAEGKRPKSKPARPPMAKENAKFRPSRPSPAKPNVTRKSSQKTNDVSDSEKGANNRSALAKPSGPPRAQAKFDYTGETDDDLTFKAGDTIMLTSKIDDDWLVGYLESNVMHQGLFPSSFVEIVVALKEQPNDELKKKEIPSDPYATAIHDFQGQSEAELSFSSGETIILLERINVEWLKGRLKTSTGIFPANFVQIERDLPPVAANKNHVVMPTQTDDNTKTKTNNEQWCQAIHDYQGEQSDELSFVVGAKIKIIERVSQEWFNGEYSGKSGIFPASFVQVISEASKTSEGMSLVTAVHDYPGESPDDLSFKTGDKIEVIERINSDWLRGECHGKQGLFPASFVEGLQSESSAVETSAMKKESAENIRMAKAIHDFTGENTGELHFSIGDVIQVIREIDGNWREGIFNGVSGIFPTAFVEIQPIASKDEVYAKALYDFPGESEHDLPFKAGDTIQILDHVNADWCSGSVGGKTGHFPSSFVQILS